MSTAGHTPLMSSQSTRKLVNVKNKSQGNIFQQSLKSSQSTTQLMNSTFNSQNNIFSKVNHNSVQNRPAFSTQHNIRENYIPKYQAQQDRHLKYFLQTKGRTEWLQQMGIYSPQNIRYYEDQFVLQPIEQSYKFQSPCTQQNYRKTNLQPSLRERCSLAKNKYLQNQGVWDNYARSNNPSRLNTKQSDRNQKYISIKKYDQEDHVKHPGQTISQQQTVNNEDPNIQQERAKTVSEKYRPYLKNTYTKKKFGFSHNSSQQQKNKINNQNQQNEDVKQSITFDISPQNGQNSTTANFNNNNSTVNNNSISRFSPRADKQEKQEPISFKIRSKQFSSVYKTQKSNKLFSDSGLNMNRPRVATSKEKNIEQKYNQQDSVQYMNQGQQIQEKQTQNQEQEQNGEQEQKEKEQDQQQQDQQQQDQQDNQSQQSQQQNQNGGQDNVSEGNQNQEQQQEEEQGQQQQENQQQ